MGSQAEQLGPDKRFIRFSANALRWAKRAYSKYQRRQGKKLLDDAPKRRVYTGWLG